MEQKNIILIVIILLVVLYCSERLLLLVRENFTDQNIFQKLESTGKRINLPCGANYIVNNLDHETISIKKAEYLRAIVNQLIEELNRKTRLHFRFIEFEHVTEQIFSDGGKRYIIDFFIHEINNYYDKRLILDIVVSESKGYIRNITIGNGRKEDIDVMKVDLYNFDHKILTDENLKFNNVIKGLNDTSLDFGTTNLKNSMGNKDFKKWIEPKEKEVIGQKTWPCREQGIWWDENGVKDTQIPSSSCRGINTSYSPSTRVAQFRPDHKNREAGENSWVFSNYHQLGSDLSILP